MIQTPEAAACLVSEPFSEPFPPACVSGRLRAAVPARGGADIHLPAEGEQDPSHSGGVSRSNPEPVCWQLDGEHLRELGGMRGAPGMAGGAWFGSGEQRAELAETLGAG